MSSVNNFTSTYKVAEDVVKAQDMFDDHVAGQSEFAERAEVVALLSGSVTNAFHQVLQAYKATGRGKRKGETSCSKQTLKNSNGANAGFVIVW